MTDLAQRFGFGAGGRRPVMLAIAGDSGAGKSTLAQGLCQAIGVDRCTLVCADDYHRFDRVERRPLAITPGNPECNYLDIMEQHLQLLATGQPILKPVYEHGTGSLMRPEYVVPREYVVVEGLLPLATKLARACFDVAVYLSPPESIRREWKVRRDLRQRGYDEATANAEILKRTPDSAAYVQPQRSVADIVVSFGPAQDSPETDDAPLSAELLLRPTVRHPSLFKFLSEDGAMHLRIIRDDDGTPVDRLHVHGHARREEILALKHSIWSELGSTEALPTGLGALPDGARSEPLAVTQLILLYHLTQAGMER